MESTAKLNSGKSHYSDTNYQLLGAIMEAITECPLSQVFQMRIFERLQLSDTFVFDHTLKQSDPLPLYNKKLSPEYSAGDVQYGI